MTDQVHTPVWPGWETEEKPIGTGGFGKVYEIHRKLFDYTEKAALKVISIPQKQSDIDEMISDGYDQESVTSILESHLKSILAEYALMRKMNGHSNIVNCDDVHYEAHADGVGWDIFIKMELLTPLTKSLPARISDDMVIKVARDMCEALELCRKHEVVHRDIKPQNIFVSDTGVYKLGDFGIAKTVEKTMGGTKIGTYNYMAPEVYHNKPYGSAADIYSLGLVLYWMLNERRMPFLPSGKLTKDATEKARNRRLFGEALPAPAHGSEELKRIVLKACAYDPADRYQTAAQMMADLENLRVATVMAGLAFTGKTQENPKQTEEEADDTVLAGLAFTGKVKEDPRQMEEESDDTVLDDDNTVLGVVAPGVEDDRDDTVLEEPKYVGLNRSGRNKDKNKGRSKEKSKDKNKDKSKGNAWIKWALLGAVILVLLLLLRSCFEGSERGNQPGNRTDNPGETTLPANVLHGMGEWSDWVEALPADVNAENYYIQEMPLYRSRALETKSSTEETSIDGWEYVETKDEPGEFGDWSEWSTEEVTASDLRQVESEERYRYRTKETTTSSSKDESGWTLYDTTYTNSNYSAWSDWSGTAVSASDTREVEKKTQYRYRDKETKTSKESSMNGWTQYDSSYEWSDYGPWSDWSDTPISESDSCEVRTREVEGGRETKYVYGAYFSDDSSRGPGASHFCDVCAAERYGGTWTYKTYSQNTRARKSYSWGLSCSHKGNVGVQYVADNGKTYYREEVSVSSGQKTQYSCRTRTKQYTYYYYRWGAWSNFSDTKVSASDKREVDTRKLYRSRTFTRNATYHFYRWTDWSDWSANEISSSSTCEVEHNTYYRYRDCEMLKVNYFQRWGDWTDFGSEVMLPTDTLKVEGTLRLRYAARPTDGSEETLYTDFTDVPPNNVYYEAVRWATDRGVMKGTSADQFSPDESCTRRQMVIILWRTMGYPEPQGTTSPFVDVTVADPFWKAVVWAVEAGIISGESADTFGADVPCTREQLITCLYRAVGSPEVMLAQEPFEDVEKDMYFYNAVLWAYEHNISSGVETTRFGVNDICSRGQIVIMLYRTFGE